LRTVVDGGRVLVSFIEFPLQSAEHTQETSPIELEAFSDTSRFIGIVKRDGRRKVADFVIEW
jgi:hypothetical protein